MEQKKTKVTVCVDGKETREFEGDCVFLVVSKDTGDDVKTGGVVLAEADAETIACAIVNMEESIDEVKRENPAIALRAMELKIHRAKRRCDELIRQCDECLGGDDNE